VSNAKLDVPQSGVDKVDLLFVIDNSGSMAEEQVKLGQQLPRLVRVLTSGDRDGTPNENGQPDFTPVSSLHLGVVSSDLGVNAQTGVRGCGDESYLANEQDTVATNTLARKPRGDEGRLLHSTDVALAGVNTRVQGQVVRAIEARQECAGVQVNRFLEFERGQNPEEIAQKFSCIAELGVNGCGYEQQLESMWRALAPSTNNTFSGMGGGQGAPGGYNAGFVRDDAVLVVILVSDEEDCSSPDTSRDTLYAKTAARDPASNVLCTRNPNALHPVSRYIDGLKSLKPTYPDRIIFAGIVGIPLAANTQGKSAGEILGLREMQYTELAGDTITLQPTCLAANNAGKADPARRMVEMAMGFGSNGVVTSICEDDYGPALDVVIEKVAEKLSSACLPRQLKVNPDGLVDCMVVEIKAANDKSPCGVGRKQPLDARTVGGSQRVVCEMTQLPVGTGQIPQGDGWYYDDFSPTVMKDCKFNRQRIAFSPRASLSEGAQAQVECEQPVPRAEPGGRGAKALDTPCRPDGTGGPTGDAKCQALNAPGESLLCVEGTCQLSCTIDADCPTGLACATDAQGRGFCVDPTCPFGE
jgi:hypothetical protein